MAAHTHAHWEFIYFMRGTGRVDLPHATLHPQPSFLVVYPPGMSHAESSDPLDPEGTVHLSIDVPSAPHAEVPLLLPDRQGHLRWLCVRIIEELRASPLPTPLAETYARALLLEVERAWDSGRPVEEDPIFRAAQYLQAHFAERLTLEDLAEVAQVSRSTLAHRFRARMHCTPMAYQRQLRVEAALRLLRTTDRPLRDIAMEVGFADAFHLSRIVKAETGQAPSSIRRQGRSARAFMPPAR